MRGEKEVGNKGTREVGNVDPDTEITFQFGANELDAEGEESVFLLLIKSKYWDFQFAGFSRKSAGISQVVVQCAARFCRMGMTVANQENLLSQSEIAARERKHLVN